MTNYKITDRDIVEYLLGGGDPLAVEAIEELSITDGDFASRIDAVEHDLVDADVSRELGGEDRRRFESHYLSSPLRREKLEFAEQLGLFREKLGTTHQDDGALVVRRSERSWPSLFTWAPALAIIGVVLVVVGYWWMYSGSREDPANPEVARSESSPPQPPVTDATQGTAESREEPGVVDPSEQPRPEIPSSGNRAAETPKETEPRPAPVPPKRAVVPSTVVSLVLSPPLRSGEQRTLSLPGAAEIVAVKLKIEATGFASYRVELREQGGREVWRSGVLRVRGGADLDFNVPAKLLKLQTYEFSVSGTDRAGKSEIIGDYPFRVVQ